MDVVAVAAQKLREYCTRFSAGAGYARAGSIPPNMRFRDWCEDLAVKGLKVDGKHWTLENRAALVPLYDLIPSTPAEAFRRIVVVQKGAQLGLTLWEILADIYMAIKFEPCTIGMYLPDEKSALYKSNRRFLRAVRTMPSIYERLIYRLDGQSTVRVGEGNVLTRVMGESAFVFLWTSGAVTTESRPFDVVSLDEVQEMGLAEIDAVNERMSASNIRFRLMLSTANMPELDINYWYKLGTRHHWCTLCEACGVATDLSEHFPSCVAYNTGQVADAPMNEYVYVCPECQAWIPDTQRGEYRAQVPEATIESYHISQIISPDLTARDMIEQWNRAATSDQKKVFFNKKLGQPYVDRSQIPVTLEDCRMAVEEGIRAGVTWENSGTETYMGVDQMGSYQMVIIKKRLPDNRQAVIHAEAIFALDPWARLGELMTQYGVAICVVEQLPSVDSARQFANRFSGRVYLASYADLRDDIITWGDALSRSDRKTSDADRMRYTVAISQYKAMEVSLRKIPALQCLFPDPAGRTQDVIEAGEKRHVQILDWFFLHFTKTALVVEEDAESRKPRAKVMKLGLDPHGAFANMLCDVGWSRVYGSSIMVIGRDRPDPEQRDRVAAMAERMPGLPQSVVAAMHEPPKGTCGRCQHFDKVNRCTLRQLGVSASEVQCVLYEELPDDEVVAGLAGSA